MSHCCLPLVLPTHRPLWRRALDALLPLRLHFLARSRPTLQLHKTHDSANQDDLWFLSGLSESLQADIGLPDAIRARNQALRERDMLWQRW